MAIFCTICTSQIPSPRDTRQTSTCSETCKNRLDAIRAEQRRSRKCTHCLSPSTPEERELFREWRASRGDVKGTVIVKRGERTRTSLVKAFEEAIKTLKGIPATAELDEQIARFEKLIDTKAED